MLTDTTLRRMKRRAALYRMADERGLVVEVLLTGSLRWRLRSMHEGKAGMLSLGVYPDMSLIQAREGRDEARRLVVDGIDPSAERKATRQAEGMTFEALARE